MTSAAHTDDADWDAYYRRTAGREPRPLLLDAMAHVPAKDLRPASAIDLGCGDGTESLHLLRAGFHVTAVDRESAAVELVATRARRDGLDSGLTAAVEDLEAVEPPRADLLLSCMSLPFLGPTALATLWERILAALHPGGVLAVNLLGDRDSWAHGDTAVAGMTFHRRNEVEAMMSGLGILQLEEHEFDGPSGRGPKHWHRYDVIARR
ncbi:class I SAM-dependent methyltransferase [Nesterenkonia xinjiangensis]|uniref:Trans-aconitate methyltransferase n=1 Tax=Nesterenkonia xinjiangensis TaxID=225327 RepID=A0A7Z0GLE6_9MICC|nr:class I SAM-dependent methyltransferase [Nesterenkonia xinjiangensis]NYJ78070.1 trans-aconitate methyltransferase [Nesterenkonia xinjiangensis]